MKLRKIAAGILAAAMAVMSVPQAMNAEEDTTTHREYNCEWVDVRPDSRYKLTVGRTPYSIRLRLSGINDILELDTEDPIWVLIDMPDGKYFSGFELINRGGEEKEILLVNSYVESHYVSPDENGKYCYYEDYMRSIFDYMYAGGVYDTLRYYTVSEKIKYNSDGEAYIDLYADKVYAESLLEAESTTVLTYGGKETLGSQVGMLSDGTLIYGDGKYIDCRTGETVLGTAEGFSNARIDSFTDLPKETVKIEMYTSEPISPDELEVGDVFCVKVDTNTGNVIGDPQADISYNDYDLYYACKVLSDETIGIITQTLSENFSPYRITIPDTIAGYTVTQLGYGESVKYSDGTSYDHDIMFDTALASINVPDTVQTIEPHAFWNNVTLEEINFGANSQLKSIGSYAFENCCSLKSITIPAGVETISERTFRTNIWGDSDYKCSLENVKFAKGSKLTTIDKWAFKNQKQLKSIELPESVTSIDPSAFEGSGLETIYGVKGSYAETFANENGFEFIEISTGDEPDPDNSNTFTDEETGVKVVDENGVLPKSAEMSVRYDDSKKEHGVISYRISFTDEYGEECDPAGDFEIWLPVPEEFQKHEKFIKVRLKGGNKFFDLKGEYKDGFMVFKTSTVGEFYVEDRRIIEEETSDSETYVPTATDEETGISVSGATLPVGAELTVNIDTENSTDTKLFYDISITKDGEEIQPEGTVVVQIPVPDKLKDKAAELKVYHFINGEYTDMNAKLENGYLVFTTDHFSVYVITPDTITDDNNGDDDNNDDDNKGDDTTTDEPAPTVPAAPSGNFYVPETTTAAATTTEAVTAAPADTAAVETTAVTTTAAAAVTAAPADTNNSSDDTTQPAASENNSSDNNTADNGASNVGNDGAANDKGENPDTGSAIAIVPVIVAAAAVSFFAYKRKK